MFVVGFLQFPITQKNQLNSFNQFTDELIDAYFTPIDNKKNIKKKNK